MKNVARVLYAIAPLLVLASCFSLPKPTAEEIAARDYWARQLPPGEYDQIKEDADRHPNFSEKRRVQYEAMQSMRRVNYYKTHGTTTRAARAPGTTRPARTRGGDDEMDD